MYSVPFRPERMENLISAYKPVRGTPMFHLGQNFDLFRPVYVIRRNTFLAFYFNFFSLFWVFFDLFASPPPAAASSFKLSTISQSPPAPHSSSPANSSSSKLLLKVYFMVEASSFNHNHHRPLLELKHRQHSHKIKAKARREH